MHSDVSVQTAFVTHLAGVKPVGMADSRQHDVTDKILRKRTS